jgi:hypothetical protein
MLEYLCAGVYFGNNRGDHQLSLVVLRINGAPNADSAQVIEALNMMLRPLPGTGSLSPSATAFSRASPLVAAIGRPPAPPSALAASRSDNVPTWKNDVMAAKPMG